VDRHAAHVPEQRHRVIRIQISRGGHATDMDVVRVMVRDEARHRADAISAL
jgi:hypothetical protein